MAWRGRGAAKPQLVSGARGLSGLQWPGAAKFFCVQPKTEPLRCSLNVSEARLGHFGPTLQDVLITTLS